MARFCIAPKISSFHLEVSLASYFCNRTAFKYWQLRNIQQEVMKSQDLEVY